MSDFDERSGVVPCHTPWGSWSQTIDEVVIEVTVPAGTRARDVACKITSHSIHLAVAKKDIIKVIICVMSYVMHYVGVVLLYITSLHKLGISYSSDLVCYVTYSCEQY